MSAHIQVDALASNLKSNDAFLLLSPAASFLWAGQGASDTETHGVQQLCDILGMSASELSEPPSCLRAERPVREQPGPTRPTGWVMLGLPVVLKQQQITLRH